MLSRTKHGGLMLLHASRQNGLGCPECMQSMPNTAQVIAETAGWLHARTAMLQISWLERSMEGGDAAPREAWKGC